MSTHITKMILTRADRLGNPTTHHLTALECLFTSSPGHRLEAGVGLMAFVALLHQSSNEKYRVIFLPNGFGNDRHVDRAER